MQLGVVFRIENRKQDQSCGTGDREEDREAGACLVEFALVGCELFRVSQPPLGEEGQV